MLLAWGVAIVPPPLSNCNGLPPSSGYAACNCAALRVAATGTVAGVVGSSGCSMGSAELVSGAACRDVEIGGGVTGGGAATGASATASDAVSDTVK